MKLIHLNELKLFNLKRNISAVIGKLDGVHLGHQKIISTLNYPKAVITFESPNKDYLLSMPSKIKMLESLGVDYLVILKNSEKIFREDKEAFIDFLQKNHVTDISCGKDFRFGYKKNGNYHDLEKHFNLFLVDDFSFSNRRISSTLIKCLLKEGKVMEIPNYLGRFYAVEGIVKRGNKIGRTIDFPTLNLDYKGYFLPKSGVYQIRCYIGKNVYEGMANLGINPTINLNNNLKLEAHLFDFCEEIYEEEVTLEFIDYIREEKSFENLFELKKKLEDDKKLIVQKTKKIL